MFRDYVEQHSDPAAPAQNRTLMVALVVAIVVLALIALVLVVT